MSEAAWTKVFHDEFLQGCRAANLKADEIGVYATILFLIASRGQPIEDDRRWIAQMSGCSTRRCNQIMQRLVEIPNKLVIRNGLIGNSKMLGVVAERDKKSTQARRAAFARWHGNEAELPLPDPVDKTLSQDKVDLKSRKNGDKSELSSRKNQPKSQNSANLDDADACFPRASARERDSEIQIPPHPDSSPVTARASAADEEDGRLFDQDLISLWESVSHVSGHNPSSPGAIDRALQFVEKWKNQGIDFEAVVLPTIRSIISKDHEPTRTLGRFDAQIQHEHARRSADKANGHIFRPPPSPDLSPSGEDPQFRDLRASLLDKLGAQRFATYANDVRFEAIDNLPGGKKALRINDSRPGEMRLVDGDRTIIVKSVARKFGFNELW